VDRRGHGDDVEVSPRTGRRIRRQLQRARPKCFRIHLMGPVLAVTKLGDAALVDVEADGVELPSERHRERKPDVTKTDDDDSRSPRHWPRYNQLIRFGHSSAKTDQ